VTPGKIRIVDLYLGKMLCFIFTCIRRVGETVAGKEISNQKIKKILFIKFIEQGATVLAYDALQEAIELVGEENVYFVVFEENREILDIMDVLPQENIFSIRSNKIHTFFLDTLKMLRRVRHAKIDATIDLEFFTRAPALIAYLTGAKVRVGLHRFTSEAPYRGDLLTHRVQYNPYLHVTELYTLFVKALSADISETPLYKVPVNWKIEPLPKLKPTKDERDRLRQKLHSLIHVEIKGSIVLLNPNASDMLPLRRWPSERFVSLGKKILENHSDVTLFITGAPSEREAAEEICRAIDSSHVLSIAGKTTLRELIVLYTLSDILVTNDSGPSHFSTLTDIDTIVLFGPETPRLYGAKRDRTHTVWAALACSPCVNVFNHRFSPCKNNVCMQAITVDDVYETVQMCLERKKDTERIIWE
jgi:ADP-heptose:LPS heptosyltransferase